MIFIPRRCRRLCRRKYLSQPITLMQARKQIAKSTNIRARLTSPDDDGDGVGDGVGGEGDGVGVGDGEGEGEGDGIR